MMNIQPGKLKNTQRKSARTASSTLGQKLGAIVKFAVVLGLAGGFLNIYIYLNQKISETDRSIRRTREQIVQTEREIEQLRVQREELSSWSYISRMVAHYNLKLVQPEAGQVARLSLIPPGVAVHTAKNEVARTAQPTMPGAGRINN